MATLLRLLTLLALVCAGIAGCAATPPAQSAGRPGDNIVNRESAPLCQLYPGNYPQTAECMIAPN